RLVPGNADAPFFADARDVDVAQSLFNIGQDLIAPGLRLNKFGVFFVELQQPVLKFRLLEEVAWLLAPNRDRVRMKRAFAAYQLLFNFEGFAPVAVPTFIRALADVAVVVNLLNKRPATARMAFLARLHEVVVADFERVPHGLEL